MTTEEAAREYSIPEGRRAAAEFLKGLPSGQLAPQGLVDLFELIYRESARAGFLAGVAFCYPEGIYVVETSGSPPKEGPGG